MTWHAEEGSFSIRLCHVAFGEFISNPNHAWIHHAQVLSWPDSYNVSSEDVFPLSIAIHTRSLLVIHIIIQLRLHRHYTYAQKHPALRALCTRCSGGTISRISRGGYEMSCELFKVNWTICILPYFSTVACISPSDKSLGEISPSDLSLFKRFIAFQAIYRLARPPQAIYRLGPSDNPNVC